MPTKVQVHRVNGEIYNMDGIDARDAVRNHPEEYSFTPFPADVQKAARKDRSIVPYVTPESYRTGSNPWMDGFVTIPKG